ncbi:ABC transporter substrate-binding protein [Plantactinospora sp. ZYX-F-223]|uniref:ABC transporter substrate-binding protein n=1 Tax=Plantactinospora sp. ZYX-F-223 TaxID=3144103 RepID=UPI0031FC8AD3
MEPRTLDRQGIPRLAGRVEDHDEGRGARAAEAALSLDRAYHPLLQELTFTRPPGFLSPKAVDASGKFTMAIGTGPWQLDSISTTTAALVRNDDYWGTKPKIDRVEFSVRKDSQTRVAALRASEVDMLGGSYPAPISPTEAVTLGRDSRVTVLHGEPDITVMLGFNRNGIAGDRAACTHLRGRSFVPSPCGHVSSSGADTSHPPLRC